MPTLSRRGFLASGIAALWALIASPAAAHERARRWLATPQHPDPRPGITDAKVATRERLADAPALIPLFDSVREMPEIVDGIRCHCGCADTPGYRSLLSCYEGDAMARGCSMCQGQARLAARLRKSGRSLDDIRVAVDAQFG